MGHHHGHPHDHAHTTEGKGDGSLLDLAVPDAELRPELQERRSFLRRAGILGAGIAGASVLPTGVEAAGAKGRRNEQAPRGGYRWLACGSTPTRSGSSRPEGGRSNVVRGGRLAHHARRRARVAA